MCEELNATFHLDVVAGFACKDAANKPPPTLLNEDGLALDVLEAPLIPEHAPVRLDYLGGESLLLTLLLRLTTHNKNKLLASKFYLV